MRRIFVLMAMGLLLAGSAAASAQMIDPSTGVMVDPTTDPADFATVASGQPGNIGMELAAQATAQAQAFAEQAQQQAMEASQTADNLFPANDDSSSTAVRMAAGTPAKTPKPVLSPNGGSFKGSVVVTISDSDGGAMIHYTMDGSKPTLNSPMYVAPLTVTAKTNVRAVADGGGLPSGVVTKTFKVKS
jgi:hypothetical protein